MPAQVKVDGSTVVAWNKAVKNPVVIHFGISNGAMPDLFSQEGLPVNLFHTGEWPVDTGAVKKETYK